MNESEIRQHKNRLGSTPITAVLPFFLFFPVKLALVAVGAEEESEKPHPFPSEAITQESLNQRTIAGSTW